MCLPRGLLPVRDDSDLTILSSPTKYITIKVFVRDDSDLTILSSKAVKGKVRDALEMILI